MDSSSGKCCLHEFVSFVQTLLFVLKKASLSLEPFYSAIPVSIPFLLEASAPRVLPMWPAIISLFCFRWQKQKIQREQEKFAGFYFNMRITVYMCQNYWRFDCFLPFYFVLTVLWYFFSPWVVVVPLLLTLWGVRALPYFCPRVAQTWSTVCFVLAPAWSVSISSSRPSRCWRLACSAPRGWRDLNSKLLLTFLFMCHNGKT